MPSAMSDQLAHWLSTFSDQEAARITKVAAEAVGLRIMELIGETYPPEPPNQAEWRGKMLHTDKQRRWWWAMMNRLARGEIVPDSLRGWRAAYRTVKGRKTLVISGHYKRSGTMVRSLNYAVSAAPHGSIIEVGPTMAREQRVAKAGETVATYAEYVIGPKPPKGKQARIHQDRWLPLFDLLERHSTELFGLFYEEAMREIQRR